MKRVLLTGGRAPAALELARCFARSGHEVLVADSHYHLTQGSSAVRAHIRVPKPRLYPQAFARALADTVRREHIDAVIPTCEEIFWLAASAAQPEHDDWRERIFAPPLEVLARLHHKMRFVDLMQSLGIRVPQTRLLGTQQDLDSPPRHRWVLKPAYSRFGTQTLMLNTGEAPRDRPRITREQPWLAQAFVMGEEVCAFAVCSRGQVQAFTLYRPRWRAGRGASLGFARIEASDPRFTEALEIVRRVSLNLNYTGQIGLDFIAAEAGLTALECNPRATSGVHVFGPADHLERAYLDALEAPIFATGTDARLGLPMLGYALPAILKTEQRAAWLETWNRSRDVLCDPQDPLPWLHQARCVIENLRQASRLRCSPLSATTADIEWNGETLEADDEPQIEWGAGARSHGDPGDARWAGEFLPELMRRDPLEFAENLVCELTAIRVNRHVLPVTVTRGQPDNAYVVSPLTHYVTYALDELRELGDPRLEAALGWLLKGLGSLLRFGRVDDVVFIDNAPISTNLHPALRLPELRAITTVLRRTCPDCAIGMRNVHGRDSRLPEYLRELGYRLIPARSVTFVPTREDAFRRKRDVRQDAKLLLEGDYRVRAVDQPSTGELERMGELYGLLYIEKYSRHNPRFTPAFLEMASRTRMLEFRALERDGRIDGLIGFYLRAGYLSVPILGYDTALPRDTGLYRMLSSIISSEAHARGVDLHASSGVAAFKRSRGGEPELEYTAVYDAHLPLRSRVAWALLEGLISWVAVPLIEGRGL